MRNCWGKDMSLQWERLAASGKTLGIAADKCCTVDRTRRCIGNLSSSARQQGLRNAESCEQMGQECYSCQGESLLSEAAGPIAAAVPYRRGSRSRIGCPGRKISLVHRPIGIYARCQGKCCFSWKVTSCPHAGRQGHVPVSLLLTCARPHFPARNAPSVSICFSVESSRTCAGNGSNDSEDVTENSSSFEGPIPNHAGNGAFQSKNEDVNNEQTSQGDISPESKQESKVLDKPSVTLIAFDIETTGLNRSDRIVEFACRDLAGGENSTLQTLVNPGKKVGDSVKVHCISDEMVNNPNVPKWHEVAPIIVQFVEGRRRGSTHVVLFAHNARNFDVPFIVNHFNDSGVPLPSHWLFLDTVPLARDVLVAKGMFTRRYSLQFMREHYGLRLPQQAHRAMDDVDVLVDVLQSIMNDLRLMPTDLLNRAFFASDCKTPAEKVLRNFDIGVQGLPSTHVNEPSSEKGDKVSDVNLEADALHSDEGLSTTERVGRDSPRCSATRQTVGPELSMMPQRDTVSDVNLDADVLQRDEDLSTAERAGRDSPRCSATQQTEGPELSMMPQSPEYVLKVLKEKLNLGTDALNIKSLLAKDVAVGNIAAHEYQYHVQPEMSSMPPDPLAVANLSEAQGPRDNHAAVREVITGEQPAAEAVDSECVERVRNVGNWNAVISGDPETTENQADLETSVVDSALLTPMLKQYVEIKQQQPCYLLLWRNGDFFEAFFEDAGRLSEACGVRLTSVDGGKVSMAGVPLQKIDVYLKMLLSKGISVLKLDQVADVDCKEGSFTTREVTGIFTPGTILDNSMLEERENNYLVAILPPSTEAGAWGLAYSDISTGEFLVTHSHGRLALVQEILRIRPAEIIYPANVPCMSCDGSTRPYPSGMPVQLCYVDRAAADFFPSSAKKKLLSCFGVQSLEDLGLQDLSFELRAAGGLLSYLQEIQTVSSRNIPLSIPRQYTIGNFMQVDETARDHLKVMKGSRCERIKGCLIWAIDHTKTAMGARLLRQWLLLPLMKYQEICCRHDAVEILASSDDLRAQLRHKLSTLGDIERLSGRVAWKRSDARDLLTLANSLQALPGLLSLLRNFQEHLYIKSIEHSLPEVVALCTRIRETLRNEPPKERFKGSGMVRDGADKELDRLQKDVESIDLLIGSYEKQEQERTGIPSLKISSASSAGRFISIRKFRGKEETIPKEYDRIQSLRHEDRYITSALLDYDRRLLIAVFRVTEREEKLVAELRDEVCKILEPLRTICRAVAAIDVLANFADLAVERNYCRPVLLEEGREITIVNGRHAVVETLLPSDVSFVPNSTYLGSVSRQNGTGYEGAENWDFLGPFAWRGGFNGCQPKTLTEDTMERLVPSNTEDIRPRPDLIILTGPNASGKSCYLRQIGLIQLLAQAGSYVPAESSRLSIADCLYTRIGPVDDLATGESTFAVEMQETAHILTSATSRSLVLLDAVGRGTGALEGEAIAKAIIEYLSQRIHARTVFATDYHNLHTLDRDYSNIANFCFSVEHDEHGAIVLNHALKPGHCLHSYALAVGRLSGFPEQVCSRAEEHLRSGCSYLPKEEETVDNDSYTTSEGIRTLDKAEVQVDLNGLLSDTRDDPLALDEGTAFSAVRQLDDLQTTIRAAEACDGSTSDDVVGSQSFNQVSRTDEAGSQHPAEPEDCQATLERTVNTHVDAVDLWRVGRYPSLGLIRGSEAPKWNVWFGRRSNQEKSNDISGQVPIVDAGTASAIDSPQEDLVDTDVPVTSSSTVFPSEEGTRMPQEELDSVWARACELLCTKPATQDLAKRKGSLLSVSRTTEGLRVCLGSSALFLKKFEQREHAAPLQSALEAVLQQPVQINFSVARAKRK